MNVSTASILDIPLAQIDAGNRLRNIDESWATVLSASIVESGLLSPIEVREPDANGMHRLVFGGHRLRACQMAGLPTIRARLFIGSDIEARIREIDENLVRRDLLPLDRAFSLAERKAIYLEMHPETARGVAGASARWDVYKGVPFTQDVGNKIGLNKRSIERSIQLAEDLAPGLRQKLAGTSLASHQAKLMSLASLDHETQREVVRRMVDLDPPIADFKAALNDFRGVDLPEMTDEQKQFQALFNAWDKAKNPRAKARFLEYLADSGVLGVAAKKARRQGGV